MKLVLGSCLIHRGKKSRLVGMWLVVAPTVYTKGSYLYTYILLLLLLFFILIFFYNLFFFYSIHIQPYAYGK